MENKYHCSYDTIKLLEVTAQINHLKDVDAILDRVLLDGSLGAHHYRKTMELLSVSSKALSGK